MPGFVRVMAVLQGATLLPEDRFINTWHFEWIGVGESYATQAPVIAEAVKNFYIVDQSNSRAISDHLSPFVVSGTVVTYDMSLPEGEREPTTIDMALPLTSVEETMPEECAVTLTMHGAPPVTPRRRGRLYIGPLVAGPDVIDWGDETGPTRVDILTSPSIGVTLTAAAAQIVANEDFHWCIRSVTPSENYVQVVGGWVDNAFDTQRRRGPDPSARRTFTDVG